MLHTSVIKTILATPLLFGLSSSVFAADAPRESIQDSVSLGLLPPDAELAKVFDNLKLDSITESSARMDFQQILKDPDMRDLSIRGQTEAMAHMQALRKRTLGDLGIADGEMSHLYVFVSHDMPVTMLRSYVREAVWSGATLVFRGVKRGWNLTDFINKEAAKLVTGKGTTAQTIIDPRLFDGYAIAEVPAIVYSEVDERNMVCTETCPGFNESKFWKMSGQVTIDYALEEFEAAGATGAAERRIAIQKALGPRAGQFQVDLKDKWDDLKIP